MFRKWLGLDKVDELIDIGRREQRTIIKTNRDFEKLITDFDKLSTGLQSQNRLQQEQMGKIDQIYKAVHNSEIDSLLKQLERSLKSLDDVKYVNDEIKESENRICSKIDGKFELVDKHLLESVEKMSQMHFRMLELRKHLVDARKELAKRGIFIESVEEAIEKTLDSQELEVLNVINRAGEIDIHDISSTLNKGKDVLEKRVKALLDLGLVEATNLGRRVLFKPNRVMAYNSA